MTRILVVEDNADLAFAVTTALQSEGFDVAVAGTGPEGVGAARTGDADLIILDLMLPGFDGYRVIRTLRESGIDTPILILTARGEEADKVKGLRLGADDYVTKPFRLRELVARMRAALRRVPHETPAGEAALVVGALHLDVARHEATLRGEPLALPLKEFELLELLMSNAGRVLTRDVIIDRVWGPYYVGDTKTLDVHIKRLRAKVEDDPAKPTRITTIRGLGYKLEAS